MEIAIHPVPKRKICKDDLRSYIDTVTNHVFFSRYSTILGRENFLKYIKRQYFAPSHNISAFERLFVIDCDKAITPTEILEIIQRIIHTYHRVGKSPAPYVCLRNLEKHKLNQIKRDLVDMGTIFTDGTCFDGDKFRMDKLIEKDKDYHFKVRFVDEENISPLIELQFFKQYFHFFLYDYFDIKTEYFQVKVEIEQTQEVMQLL